MARADIAAVLGDALDRLRAAAALAEETRGRCGTDSPPSTAELRERTGRLADEAQRVLLLLAELRP